LIRRIGWIIGTVIILSLMVAFAGTAQEEITRSPVVSTEKIESVTNLPDFQRRTSTKETSTYYYSVSTIFTTSEPINQYIQMWLEKETDQFLGYVEENKQNNFKEHRAQLHISVKLDTVTDEIHTLTFSIKNKGTDRQDATKIFNLDLTDNKILSLSDVLNVDESNVEGFRSILKEQSNTEAEISLSEWLGAAFDKPEQFNWQMNQSFLTLYQVERENSNKIEIPVESLWPYVTEYIINRLQLTPPKEGVMLLDPAGKYVALTFDDGPSPAVTPLILEILKQNGAKATFFMIGNRVQNYPEIAKQVANEGHEIGNHTGSHPNLTKLSEAQIWQEIVGNSQLIEGVIGRSPTCFRPPYGVYNPIVEKVAFEHHVPIVLWSVDSLDWKNRNPEGVNTRVEETVTPGSIVLLHDIHQSTAEALPALMTGLRNQGYQFVTISELISLQGISGNGPFYGVAK